MVSRPLVGALGSGLFEVRTKIETAQYRVLFAIIDSTMVLLHGFVKKSRTAEDEINVGRERLKEIKKG
jgi:phage-related protein